jgi:hypothetical protein
MAAPCTGNTGQPGVKYTYAELEGLWIKAGGSKGTAPIAAAIALAESGGCSGDVNPADNGGTQTSWGLWQISDGTHNKPAANIMDPAGNAQAAVAKYQASGWSPWGTYDSGAYKAFLGSSTPNLNVPGASGTISPVAGQQQAAIEPYSKDSCLFGFPGISMPVIGNVGQFCLLPKHTARAWIGAGIMAGAVFGLGFPALALLIIDVGLKGAAVLAGPTSATGRAVSFVNPAAGTALTAAGAGMRSGRRQHREPQAAETVTVRERTPISGEMGGTRDTTRTLRGPAARREIESQPARGRHARGGTRADARGTSPEFRREFLGS